LLYLKLIQRKYKEADVLTTVKENTSTIGFGPGAVSDQIKSHANDPAVLKQVEKAKETIKRVGLPKKKMSGEK